MSVDKMSFVLTTQLRQSRCVASASKQNCASEIVSVSDRFGKSRLNPDKLTVLNAFSVNHGLTKPDLARDSNKAQSEVNTASDGSSYPSRMF